MSYIFDWKLCWVVSVSKQRCVFEDFAPAWEDWKSHEGYRLIYPRIMSWYAFRELKEFNGW